MWSHLNNNFKVQFLCDKDKVLNITTNDLLQSSKYSAAGKLWWLELQRFKQKDVEVEYVGVFLCASSVEPNIGVRFTLRLVAKCDNKHVEQTEEEMKTCELPIGDGFRRLVQISTLKSEASIFCCDDKFLFEADVTIMEIDGVPVVHRPRITFQENNTCNSSSKSVTRPFYDVIDIHDSAETTGGVDADSPELNNSFDGPSPDVVVVSKCGVEFACHQYILATNSVFRNVYLKHAAEDVPGPAKKRRSSRVEKKSEFDRIVLKDMSAHALRVVLSHIYHGSLKFDIAIAGDVLHAAETHDLPLLKRECEAFMSCSLSLDTFLDYLTVAELTNAEKLKQACLSFWSKHGCEIMKTGDWDQFIGANAKDPKNIVLANSLYEKLFSSRCNACNVNVNNS